MSYKYVVRPMALTENNQSYTTDICRAFSVPGSDSMAPPQNSEVVAGRNNEEPSRSNDLGLYGV